MVYMSIHGSTWDDTGIHGHALCMSIHWRQEKMRDREGDAQSSPWDISISVKSFLDGTKTEVCFPRGPQSKQARVVAILNIHQQPLHNAISTSSDEFI